MPAFTRPLGINYLSERALYLSLAATAAHCRRPEALETLDPVEVEAAE